MTRMSLVPLALLSLSLPSPVRAQDTDAQAALHRARAIRFYQMRIARDGIVLQNLKDIDKLANEVIARQKEAIAEDVQQIRDDTNALTGLLGSIVGVAAQIAKAKAAKNLLAVKPMETMLRALKQLQRDLTTELMKDKKAKQRDEQILAQAKKVFIDSTVAIPNAAINLGMDQVELKRLQSK